MAQIPADVVVALEAEHALAVSLFVGEGYLEPNALIMGAGGDDCRMRLSESGEENRAVLEVAASTAVANTVIINQAHAGDVFSVAMVKLRDGTGVAVWLKTDGAGVTTRSAAPCDPLPAREPTEAERDGFSQIMDAKPGEAFEIFTGRLGPLSFSRH